MDFALVSQTITHTIDDLFISPSLEEWSYHAFLALRLSINVERRHAIKRKHISIDNGPQPPTSDVDLLLQHTLSLCQSQADAVQRLYGSVYFDTQSVSVYTDGCCLRNGTANAAAGAGVHWGPNARNNTSCRVPGAQTNNRGELLAVLLTIQSADRNRTLVIYTDSKYAIRVFSYWVVIYADTG